MKIVIISNNDWDGLWYQRQQFASMYAALGHEVLFVNKTLQRLPRLNDLAERFYRKASIIAVSPNIIPSNVTVKTIYTLPPYKSVNFINRWIVSWAFRQLSNWEDCDMLITYVPTYVTLDLIRFFKPKKWAYINVHNYDADQVISDLLKSEEVICKKANYLLADSLYNKKRLERISKGRSVGFSEPGVETASFFQAYRGNERDNVKTICYFGGIGNHLNLNIYNKLAESYKVIFIGSFSNASVKLKVSDKIEILPPITNAELPEFLKSIDMLGIFYNPTYYVNGVIPAKIYECIATLKPVLTSGLENVSILGDAIYHCKEENVELVINNIAFTETEEVLNLRGEIAKSADWKNRFLMLNKYFDIDEKLYN